ncbi:MAG: DUF2007 domain-containing protein [Desulforudis sp.]|jgi:hypothetical protein|nr:DUF2007 domain-containing protein [Clostridia bacterium]MDQ7790927.1 DUF2007 domain-containing protein [Clostridia bacterium]RJX21629.1 MAG: DUF2007 domain-containing protein [Desulforudis sp.]
MSRLVKVATFFSPAEAHLFKDLLDAQGITGYLFDEQLQVLIPHPMGGIKLMVAEEDRQRAIELIQELEQSDETEIRYLDE